MFREVKTLLTAKSGNRRTLRPLGPTFRLSLHEITLSRVASNLTLTGCRPLLGATALSSPAAWGANAKSSQATGTVIRGEYSRPSEVLLSIAILHLPRVNHPHPFENCS